MYGKEQRILCGVFVKYEHPYIIVEIQKDGRIFLVGIHFNQNRYGIEVPSIRGIFPKDNAEWLNWINQGKLLYIDKAKIQALIDKQRKNLAEVEYLDLDSFAKVVQNFENPIVDEEKIVSALTKKVRRKIVAFATKNMIKRGKNEPQKSMKTNKNG